MTFFWQACFSYNDNEIPSRESTEHDGRAWQCVRDQGFNCQNPGLICKLVTSHPHVFITSLLLLQTCADPKTRLSFLTDKAMETAIKYINKKFPNIDFRGNIVSMTATFAQPSVLFSPCFLHKDMLVLAFHVLFCCDYGSIFFFYDFNTKRVVCSWSIYNQYVIHWK